MRLGFAMPAYNEEALLGETLDALLPKVDVVVVVNDGSTDRTGEIADGYARSHPGRVDVVHQENAGIGTAVLVGLQRLLTHHDVDALGIIASDNQCDADLVPVFRYILESFPELDVAKGSRFLHPETLHQMPRFRYWGNRGVSFTLQLILGYHGMSDVLHGYLLARREVFERMDFSRIADGYDLENTMMAEFRRLRCSFGLVPSPSRYGSETSAIVYHRQIPKTLGYLARTTLYRMTHGSLTDRLAPALVATGNLPAAYLVTRMTSPGVRVFSASVPSSPTAETKTSADAEETTSR